MANLKKNFMYQSMYQILTMILPLVTSPILSAALGAEGVGIYTYVTTIESYFVLVANLGIYKYGTREIAKVQSNREEVSRVFREIWILHALLSIAVGFLYIFYIVMAGEYLLFFSISFLGYIASAANLGWLFAGMEDFRKITIRDAAVKVAAFFLIIILVKDETDLAAYFWLMSICSLLAVSFYWVLYREYIDKVKVDVRGICRHFRGMLVLFIPLLLESLFNSMDKVMLGVFCSKAEVGYYGNAEKALICKRLIYSLSIVLLPKMSYLISMKNREEYDRLMKQSVGLIILLSSVFGLGTAAVAKEFSEVFWGADFAACADLIIIMSAAIPGTMAANTIREQYLIASGNERKYLFAAGTGTLVNLVLNLLLIPRYGAVGAAIATLASEYTVCIVQIIVVRKDIPIVSYLRGNGIYLLFGIVMFAVVRWSAGRMSGGVAALLAEIALGGCVFVMMCVIYWLAAGQYYYLRLMRKYGKKVLQRFSRKSGGQ